MLSPQLRIHVRRVTTALAFTPLLLGGTLADRILAANSEFPEQIRRPVAILPVQSSAQLVVLNRQSGTASRIDLSSRKVVDEESIAVRIRAAALVRDGRLAVLDDHSNTLVLVTVGPRGAEVVARRPVPAAPVNVVATPDGQGCVVASSWARRLTVFSWSDPDSPAIGHTIDLPFAPGQQRFVDRDRLLVADAFGGYLALVDPAAGTIVRLRELRSTHNIAGIAVAEESSRVFLTHQMLSDEQATTQPNVHWGDVMSNVVRQLDLEWFVSDQEEETTAADLYYLGYPDSAAGDPAEILVGDTQRFIVALAGVNQVAVSDRGLNHFHRLEVGRRPRSMWLDSRHGELFVANQMDDSISVIDLGRSRVVDTISLGPTGPLGLADEGEQLFYDARLSSDGWFSCHSCHTDGHTNGQRSDTFGDGYQGAPKQVPSLLGSADTTPWGWNGKTPMLEAQIRKSIETTMRGEIPTPHQVQALAAYLMRLSPPPSLRAARGDVNSLSLERGRAIFKSVGCTDCHLPPTYTSPDVYDVGLADPDGQREFNPPSLLGVGHRRRLLHDGRAKAVREALQVHPSGKPMELNEAQWRDLHEFLLSL